MTPLRAPIVSPERIMTPVTRRFSTARRSTCCSVSTVTPRARSTLRKWQIKPSPLPRMSSRWRSRTRSWSQREKLLMPPQAICSSAVTRPPDRVGGWRFAVIMVGETVDEVKTDAASFKKFQGFRRTVDERRHSVVVETAAAEKPQIGDNLLARVGVAGRLRQMILADPDQPVRIDRAAAQCARLFEDDRPQAEFMGGERRGEASDAGPENDDVPGIAHVGAGREKLDQTCVRPRLRRTVARRRGSSCRHLCCDLIGTGKRQIFASELGRQDFDHRLVLDPDLDH